MTRPGNRTDELLLACLQASETPMTAYELLASLRGTGIQSPPVVYRSLERMVKSGTIHRLDRLNAYVACHGHKHGALAPVFAVCTRCSRVEEWSVDQIDANFNQTAATMGFTIEDRTIELRGICRRCRGLADADAGAACCEHTHTHSAKV